MPELLALDRLIAKIIRKVVKKVLTDKGHVFYLIESDSIDYVFIPHSLNFISSLDRLYSEVKRVLKRGGHFLFGTANPALYIFDERKMEKGKIKAKYTIPFSDEKSKSEKELRRMMKKGDTFVLSVEKDEIKLEKKKKLSQDDYDALISMAAEYAKETGLDTLDCYSIVEEYINSL